MSEYFLEPKSSGGRVKVELDLSNYATNADLKNSTGVNPSKFAKKFDLANLKSNVDKLDIDKLRSVPTKSKTDILDVDEWLSAPIGLSELSNVVKSSAIKKAVYNAKIKNIEDKIPDITNLAANASLNAKINKVKRKISNITNLANTTALTAAENTIADVSNLVKKTDCSRKLKIKLILIMIMISYYYSRT